LPRSKLGQGSQEGVGAPDSTEACAALELFFALLEALRVSHESHRGLDAPDGYGYMPSMEAERGGKARAATGSARPAEAHLFAVSVAYFHSFPWPRRALGVRRGMHTSAEVPRWRRVASVAEACTRGSAGHAYLS
jgi:hypothetical protein